MAITNRHKTLLNALDALEQGRYCGLNIQWCGDTTSWLWKWRKISKEEMEELCDRVITLCNAYKGDKNKNL